jgi:GntR family transcriptional regulator/MocR family aminotransferase
MHTAVRRIQSLYHYPIKGLSAQPLARVELAAGRPLPWDRVFALARPGAPIDVDAPAWAKKGQFVMLMFDDALAQVHTRLDPDTLALAVRRRGHRTLQADLGSASGRADAERYVADLVPALGGVPRLVRAAPDGHFMDKPDAVVSMVNLATVHHLEALWGQTLDPLRLRANVYIDGVEPWEEFDWIGASLQLGQARVRVDRRNGRCAATNVDPASGARDRDIPGALRRGFGHKDLGVYLTVLTPGTVAVGDPVDVPGRVGGGAVPSAPGPGGDAGAGPRRHLCSGCYFVYDERLGLPAAGIAPGTVVAGLPGSWRCPDCGADASRLTSHTGGGTARAAA